MKLKKLTNLKYKLIKLELIRSKITQNNVFDNRFKETEAYLKKALLIIFQYHLNNKKILFIGLPKTTAEKYKQTFNQTNHLFLPDSYWIKGLLTNKVTVFRYIKKRVDLFTSKKIKSYFLLKTKPHLIVLFSPEADVIKEAVKLRIPVISLSSIMSYDKGVSYQLPLKNNDSIKTNSFFLSLLNSMFKKTE